MSGFVQEYSVAHSAFDTAGEASSKIKATLKKLGVAPAIIRDVAIAAYETELNLVIHSLGGTLTLEVSPERITLVSRDVGPGIKDVELALSEGFSTAPDSVRDMGFGAGMGLPNVRRHCHDFHIESAQNSPTIIEAIYYLT